MRRLDIGPIACLAVASLSVEAAGQGVAGASVLGTVTVSAQAVFHAEITLRNDSTGNVFRAVTSTDGTFRFDNLPVVGVFTLEVRAIGYRPVTEHGLVLQLGDRVRRDVALDESARPLDTIRVEERAGARDPGAGGPAVDVPGDVALRLPLLNRDFVGLLALSSQANGKSALSIGGQHSRFNAIQIDGGSAGDFFGVSATTGAGNGARSIPLDAIQEIRILVSPFDVRYGGFSGGVINAVTRSGTNERRTSVLASGSASDLVGDTPGLGPPQRFSTIQYAVTTSGPIVRDRLHYFASAEAQREQGPAVSTVAVDDSTAARIAQISRDVYGFDPGGTAAPVLRNPTWNGFGKLAWQASSSHLIDVSVNALGARADALGRSMVNTNNRNGWALSNSGSVGRTEAMSVRARLASGFGSASNEIVATSSATSDRQDSQSPGPLFLVQTDSATAAGYVAAGSFSSAEGTRTDQRMLELTDDASWTLGSHVVTFGGQAQLLHVRDNIVVNSRGAWAFQSVAAYEARVPSYYEVSVSQRPSGSPLADYSSRIYASYAQDRWSPSPNLTVTAGLRVDVPTFDRPYRDSALAGDAPLGHIDTSVFPSGNGVVSPRAGFSYSIGPAERPWIIRGGAGAFTARPPYVWLTNAYSGTGVDVSTLVCRADKRDGVPPPVTDLADLPHQCTAAASGTAGPTPTVTLFAANTRFPQTLKANLGVEKSIGAGVVASVDVTASRTRNSLTVVDRNLVAGGADAEGRVMYDGPVPPTSSLPASPLRLDAAFGPVYQFSNVSGDRYTSVTAHLGKQWTDARFLQIGYTWSRTLDRNSLLNTSTTLLAQNNPIEGSIEDRALARSNRDVPNTLVAAGGTTVSGGVAVSGILRASSGTPFDYVVRNDANADGIGMNDLLYVPRTAKDMLFSPDLLKSGALAALATGYRALDAFIDGEPCLRAQRGRIMARNSCRNPASWSLDAKVAKAIRGLELSVDVFDVPNLIDSRWGVTRETTEKEGVPIVTVVGWDAAGNRPRYSFSPPVRNALVPGASEWRIQLGARQQF